MDKRKTLEQALLDKILFIGDEVPEYFVTDKRPKFIILGSPQELINEVQSYEDGFKAGFKDCQEMVRKGEHANCCLNQS